jgi:hypothetical protein
MKKILLLLCLSFFVAAFAQAQNIRYESNIKYSNNASGITADITITVLSGTPEFTYYLTTNHPYKSEVLHKSGPTKKSTYTFRDIPPGTYFIKIQDQSGDQTGKTIIIDATEN